MEPRLTPERLASAARVMRMLLRRAAIRRVRNSNIRWSPPVQLFGILIEIEHVVQQGPLGHEVDYGKLRQALITMASERLGASKKTPADGKAYAHFVLNDSELPWGIEKPSDPSNVHPL